MAAPVGPTGCEQAGGDAEHRFLVGATYGLNEPALRFDGEADYDLLEHAAVGSIGYRLAPRTIVQFAAGAIFAGEMTGEGRSYDLGPGFTMRLSAAHQWIGRSDEVPFFTTTLAYTFSTLRATETTGAKETLSASDLRIGTLFGMTFRDLVSPYLSARAFVGPVELTQDGRDRQGTDRRKYALGLGSALTVDRFELLVDATFFGERSLSVGASVAF